MNQFQEYFLQGSVLDGEHGVDVLLERLRGLTDSGPQKFDEHELVFSLRIPNSPHPTTIRARRTVDPQFSATSPWHLRYVGMPEPDIQNQCPTLVRKTVDSMAQSENLMGFLRELGFRLDYEFLTSGWAFTKGTMRITVAKIYRLKQLGMPTGDKETLTNSHFVELSITAAFGQDSVAQDLKIFADQLRPIVNLEKSDFNRNQQGTMG